jgi:hypothetical protein
MPSATKPCDLDRIPTTICTVVSTRLTATLTQVLRAAAAARSSGVCNESSESSSGVINMGCKR